MKRYHSEYVNVASVVGFVKAVQCYEYHYIDKEVLKPFELKQIIRIQIIIVSFVENVFQIKFCLKRFFQIILNTFLGGILSDRFGRRRICLIYSLIHIASSFATAFASKFVNLYFFEVFNIYLTSYFAL